MDVMKQFKDGIDFGRACGASHALFLLRLNHIMDLNCKVIEAIYGIDREEFSRDTATKAVMVIINEFYEEVKKQEEEYDKQKNL